MKKILLSSSLVITSMFSFSLATPSTNVHAEATQNGWVQSNSNWYYYQNGTIKTGWVPDNNNWYYLNPDNNGAMTKGWVFKKDNKNWYYLDPVTGVMKTGWQKINEKWYYLTLEEGDMKKGWQQINGLWYYLDPENGDMKTGWQQVYGFWYYLAPTGEMKTGWQQINGCWYYLNETNGGAMTTGQLKINNIWRYFTSSGHWVDVLDKAQDCLGIPYVWGGKDSSGLDCSGLVYYSWNKAGYNRGYQTSQDLYNSSQKITRADAEPGDLVFFSNSYSTSAITHVAIYLGNGDIIEASSGSANQVKYSTLSTSWYQNHLVGFGRITNF
ncbi:NlpC/P60 family protein [Microbacteriaceae bacterium 4G12]